MQIDPTYLVPHPETVKWWAQREQCNTCRHLSSKAGEGGEGVMRCRAAQRPAPLVRRMLAARGVDPQPYCVDARGAQGDCGPQARLYAPRAGSHPAHEK